MSPASLVSRPAMCVHEGVMLFSCALSHNSARPPLCFLFLGHAKAVCDFWVKGDRSVHSVNRDGSHQDWIILDVRFLREPSQILPQPRCLESRGQQSLWGWASERLRALQDTRTPTGHFIGVAGPEASLEQSSPR